MRISALSRALALAAVVAAPSLAGAQFTVYTTLASFLAATTNAGTDSFDDLAVGSVATPLTRTAGAYGYTASANTLGFYATGVAADRWLSTDVGTDVVTFAGFGAAVRGVGGVFFGTDLNGDFRSATSIVVRATGAGGTRTETLVNTTVGTFLGFVSTGAFTSLSVESVQPAAGDVAWPTVNNLVLAQAATSTVPEPSTVVILATGLVGLAAVARTFRTPRGRT